jgi:hypothetical protein
MPHGVSIMRGREGLPLTRRVRKRESETGRQQDTPYRRSSPEWSLRMGLVMREVRCKSFGRRNQKIKKCKPVYIPSPVIRHHKMPSRKKPFPFRGTRKDVWTPAQIKN